MVGMGRREGKWWAREVRGGERGKLSALELGLTNRTVVLVEVIFKR